MSFQEDCDGVVHKAGRCQGVFVKCTTSVVSYHNIYSYRLIFYNSLCGPDPEAGRLGIEINVLAEQSKILAPKAKKRLSQYGD